VDLADIGIASDEVRDQAAQLVESLRSEQLLIRVGALQVLRLAGRDDQKVEWKGQIGQTTYDATPDDDIQVTAQVSRPAYCYLIIFRPDGKDEVLYPQAENVRPELTKRPTYPSRNRSVVYGLTDGTGLWLVALVACRQALPEYAEWRRRHPGGPWRRSEGKVGVVWTDDGNWLEALTANGPPNRGTRDDKMPAGASLVMDVVDWLKAETGGAVSAVGFTVQPKN
jgi:hypothetical protein